MLSKLSLFQFRCFERLDLQLGSGRTFVVGRNAQGKTSILEAACVLLRLQSPRTSSLSEAIRFGQAGLSLSGRCNGSHLQCHYTTDGREIVLDSKSQSRSDDYLDVARVAWFSNADLELVRGGASVRRRYMDFMGMQVVPGYRKALRAYERAVRSRNALLKDGRSRREIAAFDAPMIESGETLRGARGMVCEFLAPLAQAACSEISGVDERLVAEFRPGFEGDLRGALDASREQEERLRQTVVGPHRDDVHLLLGGLPAATFASEGQQRSIALALKLAQARYLESAQGRPPVLLLDDIFGELDPDRRNRLLSSLPAGAQAIITTTSLEWAGNTDSDSIFRLESGVLTPASHGLSQ